jgi:hypothetical protein
MITGMDKDENAANFADPVAMFGAGLEPNYLGGMAVVGELVAKFCSDVYGCMTNLSDGEMDKAEFAEACNDLINEYAAIFRGEDPDYPAVRGWNDFSLPIHLKVALAPYWNQHRAAYDNDPVRVFFAWLVWATSDAMMLEDPDLRDAKMRERIQQSVRLLAGTPTPANG